MADQLAGIKGAFVLSINDVQAIRECFRRFHLDTVRLTYTISEGTGKHAQELIVSNREVKTGLL